MIGYHTGSTLKHTKLVIENWAEAVLKMGYQPGKSIRKKVQGIILPTEEKVHKGKGTVNA